MADSCFPRTIVVLLTSFLKSFIENMHNMYDARITVTLHSEVQLNNR